MMICIILLLDHLISLSTVFRQFKEQQRLARQETPGGGYQHNGHKTSDPGPRGSISGHYTKTQEARAHQAQTRTSVSDIKSAQKEAVISYMDRVGGGPRAGSAGAPPDIAPPPPPSSASPRHPAPNGLSGHKPSSTSIPTARSLASSTSRPR